MQFMHTCMHQVATYIETSRCTQKPGALLLVKPVFAIQCIEMTSREQRLATKEQIAMHTNLFFGFNPLDTQIL